MRNLFLFILILTLSLPVQSQNLNIGLESNTLLDSLPIVNGILLNYDPNYNKDVFINYTIISPNFKGIYQKTATIKEDGSFNLELEQALPYQKIILNISDFYTCYVIANQDLMVSIDINEVSKKEDNYANKGLVFSGTDAELNQFFNEYKEYKTDKKIDIRKRKFSTLMNRTSQTDFKVKQIREYYKELEKIESTFTRKHGRTYAWLLENERYSELYGDIASVFIGKTMSKELWKECIAHQPAMVSELSNRYYGILANKIWSHEENEIRSLSRMIYKADVEDPEEKKAIDLFLTEQDKKKAGVPYDKEIYENGLENYIKRYESQLADAKLNLFTEKLSQLPKSKIGLVAIKGEPQDETDKEKYYEAVLDLVKVDWHQKLIANYRDVDKKWVQAISTHMVNAKIEGSDPTLGNFQEYLASSAGVWKSKATDIPALLSQIRNFYKGKSIVIFVWDTDCISCIEELTRSGVSYDRITAQPIEILTLALNKNTSYALWKDTLAKTFAKGEHIFLDKNLTSEIFEYFQLPPVPSYIYFDNEGNFIPYKVSSISNLDVEEVLETDG